MELRTLHTFVRIAEEKSFTRAAGTLHYAQSTVTAQIKQLEEELGVRLFDRVGRQIYVTDAGHKLLSMAYDMLRMEESAQKIGKSHKMLEGTIRIGLIQSLQNHILLPHILEFRKRHPAVKVIVEEANGQKLADMLCRNEIDLAYFFQTKITDENLVVVDVQEERMYFAAPHNHPLCQKAAPDLEEILSLPFLTVEQDQCNAMLLRQCLADRGLQYYSTFQVGNPDIILRMIRAGEGISWLPHYVIADAWEAGEISVFDYQFPEVHVYRQVAHHRDKWMSDCMRAWLAIGTANQL